MPSPTRGVDSVPLKGGPAGPCTSNRRGPPGRGPRSNRGPAPGPSGRRNPAPGRWWSAPMRSFCFGCRSLPDLSGALVRPRLTSFEAETAAYVGRTCFLSPMGRGSTRSMLMAISDSARVPGAPVRAACRRCRSGYGAGAPRPDLGFHTSSRCVWATEADRRCRLDRGGRSGSGRPPPSVLPAARCAMVDRTPPDGRTGPWGPPWTPRRPHPLPALPGALPALVVDPEGHYAGHAGHTVGNPGEGRGRSPLRGATDRTRKSSAQPGAEWPTAHSALDNCIQSSCRISSRPVPSCRTRTGSHPGPWPSTSARIRDRSARRRWSSRPSS